MTEDQYVILHCLLFTLRVVQLILWSIFVVTCLLWLYFVLQLRMAQNSSSIVIRFVDTGCTAANEMMQKAFKVLKCIVLVLDTVNYNTISICF